MLMAVERTTDTFVAPGAQLSGQVRMASESSVWFGATVRGEAAPVELGPQANVQDNCVVEGRPGQPVRIGARTSLGHNARVFGATIGERCLIAIGATVLPGASVGMHSIVAANATVLEGVVVPPRTLVIGQGRFLRAVTQAEIERIEFGATDYARLTREYGQVLAT
jgi:carbonic anhydrase/acetyltransferase-like protein (isoleucine patch superfamily)